MDDRSYVVGCIEEINTLLNKKSYFLHQVSDQIHLMRDQINCTSNEKKAVEFAIEAKQVIENFIRLRTLQAMRGPFAKCALFFKDRLDIIRAARNLNSFTESLKKTRRADQEFEDQLMPPTLEDLEYEARLGRETAIEVIRTKLMMTSSAGGSDNNTYVLHVLGEQSIGKTPIACKVFQDNAVRAHFDCFAWINNGCDYETMSGVLLKRLWDQVSMENLLPNDESSLEFDEYAAAVATAYPHDYDMLKWKLYNFLKYRRYLIVIDSFIMTDAWHEFLFPGLAETATPRGLEGSRIMLLTNLLPSNVPHHGDMGPLSDAESWKLFTSKVRPFVLQLPPELLLIGRQIVRNCYGIPKAITEVAKRLSQIDPTFNAWLHCLHTRTIKRSLTYTIGGSSSSLLPLTLQSCVSYLQLFPKNYEISVRRLIALWIAEDIVKPENDLSLKHIGMDCLQQLIDNDAIQVTQSKLDGKPKTCRLNQLHHNMHDPTTTRSRRLFVHHTKNLGSHASGTKSHLRPFEPYKFLLSFLCFDYRRSFEPSRQVKYFFQRGISKNCLLFLKVIDLEGVYKPVFPKEMKSLTNLRYLGLRDTYIDTLPEVIGKLYNLRTLDVKHTFINSFPKWICKLQHLQHLYMSENHRGKFVYKAGSLVNLESLWGIFINDESHVGDGLNLLANIKNLGLTYHLKSTTAIDEWILNLVGLQSLKLKSKDELNKPSSMISYDFRNHKQLSKVYLLGKLERSLRHIGYFPPYLRKLTLSASKLEEDPMPTLGVLPNLIILRLYADSYVGQRMVCSSSKFRQLKVLKMWKLEKLEEWTVEEGSMPIIQELDIGSCKRLSMLPVELQQITTIQELKLTDMSKVFVEQVKHDNDWSKKEYLCFPDLNISKSLGGSSSFGSLALLHLLAGRGVFPSLEKHATPKGLPPLKFQELDLAESSKRFLISKHFLA